MRHKCGGIEMRKKKKMRKNNKMWKMTRQTEKVLTNHMRETENEQTWSWLTRPIKEAAAAMVEVKRVEYHKAKC